MSIRQKVEAWIVRYILRRHYGKLRLLDGTVAAHQSAEFHGWCYGPGYMLFTQQDQEATNGQD